MDLWFLLLKKEEEESENKLLLIFLQLELADCICIWGSQLSAFRNHQQSTWLHKSKTISIQEKQHLWQSSITCFAPKCERIVFREWRDIYDAKLFLASSSWGQRLRFEVWSLRDRKQQTAGATWDRWENINNPAQGLREGIAKQKNWQRRKC